MNISMPAETEKQNPSFLSFPTFSIGNLSWILRWIPAPANNHRGKLYHRRYDGCKSFNNKEART